MSQLKQASKTQKDSYLFPLPTFSFSSASQQSRQCPLTWRELHLLYWVPCFNTEMPSQTHREIWETPVPPQSQNKKIIHHSYTTTSTQPFQKLKWYFETVYSVCVLKSMANSLHLTWHLMKNNYFVQLSNFYGNNCIDLHYCTSL